MLTDREAHERIMLPVISNERNEQSDVVWRHCRWGGDPVKAGSTYGPKPSIALVPTEYVVVAPESVMIKQLRQGSDCSYSL